MTGVVQTDELIISEEVTHIFVGRNNFTWMRKVSFNVFNLPDNNTAH